MRTLLIQEGITVSAIQTGAPHTVDGVNYTFPEVMCHVPLTVLPEDIDRCKVFVERKETKIFIYGGGGTEVILHPEPNVVPKIQRKVATDGTVTAKVELKQIDGQAHENLLVTVIELDPVTV